VKRLEAELKESEHVIAAEKKEIEEQFAEKRRPGKQLPPSAAASRRKFPRICWSFTNGSPKASRHGAGAGARRAVQAADCGRCRIRCNCWNQTPMRRFSAANPATDSLLAGTHCPRRAQGVGYRSGELLMWKRPSVLKGAGLFGEAEPERKAIAAYQANVDGGSRGNPGPAAYGVVCATRAEKLWRG